MVPRWCSCRLPGGPHGPSWRVLIPWLHACWGKGPLPNGPGFWSCLACRWAGQGLPWSEAMTSPWAGGGKHRAPAPEHCPTVLWGAGPGSEPGDTPTGPCAYWGDGLTVNGLLCSAWPDFPFLLIWLLFVCFALFLRDPGDRPETARTGSCTPDQAGALWPQPAPGLPLQSPGFLQPQKQADHTHQGLSSPPLHRLLQQESDKSHW